jgi:hypothetical protein
VTRALIELPIAQVAPGIRDQIRETAQWSLREVTSGFGEVEPLEGAGTVTPYFKIRKLCDAKTRLTDETWAPLLRNPALLPEGFDPPTRPGGASDPNWRERLFEQADKFAADGRRGGDLAAVSAGVFALPPENVPSYLQRQVPALFEGHPEGSLWFFETSPLLRHRLGLLRVLLAFELLPDYGDALKAAGDEHPQIKTLQEHSLTHGFQFDALVEPILLAVPPATLGYVFPWSPHALVFLFGHAASLIEPHPPTFASLYSPRVQRGGFGTHWNPSLFEDLTRGEIEALLQWWVTRLNVIYSYATDPTAFTDPTTTRMRPSEPTAWLLTFERMLADVLTNASMPQGPPIARLALAFDLLDKAEALLDFRKGRSGDGAKRLMQRREMLDRLDRIWNERLPVQVRLRFQQHSRELYDRVYSGVQAEAYDHRVEGHGIKVWSQKNNRLDHWSWDGYVPALVRAVRNSAHGLLEALSSKDRGVIESHSGLLPAELPDLASLIAVAMVADAENLCAGTWL